MTKLIGKNLRAAAALGAMLAPVVCQGQAAAQNTGFRRAATIPMTAGGTNPFDISWVDPTSGRYFLGDRASKSIDVVDTRTNTMAAKIAGFVGQDPKGPKSYGPSGVVVIPGSNQAWAGDGDSTVKVVDLEARKIVDSISTGGKARADEIAYDDRDQIIIIGNDADEPVFLTLISAKAGGHKVLGKIPLPDATDGLEQPVWDRAMGRFYVAVPETKAHPGGEVIAVDPVAVKITDTFPVEGCNPHGLALGPAQNLLVGCRMKALIMNLRKPGSFVTVPEAGGSDEVWFNPGDDKYFLASARGGLGVIDAITNAWIGSVETGPGAHSVAADPVTNRIYVPIAANPKDPACSAGCIAVFENPKER